MHALSISQHTDWFWEQSMSSAPIDTWLMSQVAVLKLLRAMLRFKCAQVGYVRVHTYRYGHITPPRRSTYCRWFYPKCTVLTVLMWVFNHVSYLGKILESWWRDKQIDLNQLEMQRKTAGKITHNGILRLAASLSLDTSLTLPLHMGRQSTEWGHLWETATV